MPNPQPSFIYLPKQDAASLRLLLQAESGSVNRDEAHVVRIEVEPLKSDTRYWSFLSMASNRMQHFCTLLPKMPVTTSP
jgi:hypothetical protein